MLKDDVSPLRRFFFVTDLNCPFCRLGYVFCHFCWPYSGSFVPLLLVVLLSFDYEVSFDFR